VEITAVFDSIDTAELALLHLQRQGILPIAYKIKTTRPLFYKKERDAPEVTAGFTNNIGGGMQSPQGAVMGLNAQAMGSFSEPVPQEARREVIMNVTVEDARAVGAHRALVSCHGRRVKYV